MRLRMSKIILICCALAVSLSAVSGQTWLRADGTSDTYSLFNSVLGGTATEVPDCGHSGKHIWQGLDGVLNKQVFYFSIHKNEDDDRCQTFDRQRVEIKSTSNHLVGGHGESISYSWNFKLDAGFQPSTAFTHIHQLKAVGGNEKQPVITITPRKGSTNTLQIIHISNSEVTTHIGSTNLAPFLGTWVHVKEEATYWNGGGKYSVKFTRVSDGSTLYSLEKTNIDMWRDGASYIRGKWGIYRSLNDKGSLRDEQVRMNDFCLGKANTKCN